MLALRQAGAGKDARAALRALAAEWPGALKELDTLPTEELERRRRACADGDDAPWIAWMARYHALMRAALALRGRDADAAAVAVDAAGVDAAFVASVVRPAHGRLNVAVFASLSREVGRPASELWDALFPARGKSPRAYRR